MPKPFTMLKEMAAYLVKYGLCAVCWKRDRYLGRATCKRCQSGRKN